MRTIRKPMNHRQGLSLLEVLLSIAILGASLAVIGSLVRIGIISALDTRLRSQANILCDATMAELSAGVLELRPYSETPIPNEPDWYFSVDVQDSPQLGLLYTSVTVGQTNVEDPLMVKIDRFLPDPDFDPSELEEEEQ